MKHFRTILITLLIMPGTWTCLPGQDLHGQDHDHETHHHPSREIGLGAGPVYLLGEQEWAPGFHIHYLQSFGKGNWFSLAPGVEWVFDEHRHTVISLSLGFRPVHPLYLGIAPGFSLNRGGDVEPALHLEALYEFDLGPFHMGPMTEYGLDPDDRHLMLGVHVGFPF